jgi:hypothetical protein
LAAAAPPSTRACAPRVARGSGPHYERHRPEESVLYGVIQRELESFLAQAAARDRAVPRFVEREFRAYLRCGILAHGFARVHCDACGFDRVVAFSCKGRGFCPSCGGRRMADTAAHLVDRVFPEVPVRQWVLSFPFALRYRLAYDALLMRAVSNVFIRTVFSSLRRRARERFGLTRSQCGAVTFVQRFGDAFRLNPHLHSLVLDGVYAREACGALRFYPLPPPEDSQVARVAGQLAKRIARLLERHGLGEAADSAEADSLAEREPLLAALYSASITGRVATGRRAGQRVLRLGDRIDAELLPALEGERCASVHGFSLHANVAVPARDRRLERLCRYVGRPALASERLSHQGDGRLLYQLKQRWRDGTTHVVFETSELLEKLAALVPPPRFHLVRYHGILGPCASDRDRIVPRPSARESRLGAPSAEGGSRNLSVDSAESSAVAPRGDPTVLMAGAAGPSGIEAIPEREFSRLEFPAADSNLTAARAAAEAQSSEAPRLRRLGWAELLRRVFAIDVLACPRCGDRLRLLSAIHSDAASRAILDCLGLASRAPPAAEARVAITTEVDGDCDPGPEDDWNQDRSANS